MALKKVGGENTFYSKHLLLPPPIWQYTYQKFSGAEKAILMSLNSRWNKPMAVTWYSIQLLFQRLCGVWGCVGLRTGEEFFRHKVADIRKEGVNSAVIYTGQYLL